MNRHFIKEVLFIVFMSFVHRSIAQTPIKPVKAILLTSRALTVQGDYGLNINGQAFQKEALATYKSFQYGGFYNANRQLCIFRRNLRTNKIDILSFPYILSKDDAHNTISLGFCANDGTLHIAFDHHNNTLNYIRSKKYLLDFPEKTSWKLSQFLPLSHQLDEEIEEVSYPSFVSMPDGNLQLFYRKGKSGDGQNWMVTYKSQKSQWQERHAIDSPEGYFEDDLDNSRSRNAYYNGWDYDKNGVLYTTFTWREKADGANHDWIYAFSKDQGKSWKNNRGETVAHQDSSLLMNLESKHSIIRTINRKQSLMNQQAQAVDSKGRIHVVYWSKLPNKPFKEGEFWDRKASGYYHLWRDTNGKWYEKLIIAQAGTRPQILFDANDHLYLLYYRQSAREKITHPIYFEKGELVMLKATSESQWKKWKIIGIDTHHLSILEPKPDVSRFQQTGIISLMQQTPPTKAGMSSPLSILEYQIKP
jgi:hypothetical protein